MNTRKYVFGGAMVCVAALFSTQVLSQDQSAQPGAGVPNMEEIMKK